MDSASYCTVCKSHLTVISLPKIKRVPSDLYGRGFSDAPSTTYGSMLYTTQLALLLQYLGWRSTNVAGVSMVIALGSSPLMVA